MKMYRLVAYHNDKIERDTIDFSSSISNLINKIKELDVNTYRNHTLTIEDNGKTVSRFHIQNNMFIEQPV